MVPELPVGVYQAYVSGSVSEFSLHIWEKCFEWGLGYIRCTGRYDNISFIIKTPFLTGLCLE